MVGYLTNWLAIKLIFEPAEPKKVGPFVLHGLFHKRQAGVAKQFAELVSNDILNPDTIVAKMIEGEQGVILFGIVEKRVDELLEKYRQHPMAKTAIPEDEWPTLRNELFQRIRDQLAAPGGFLHTFTSRAVNVYGQLLDRMTELDSESFEGVLRPAFQKDEWKLILAGAALGTGAGFLQVIFLFGDAVTG